MSFTPVVEHWISSRWSRIRPCAGGVVGGETELTGKVETHMAEKPRRHTPSIEAQRERTTPGAAAPPGHATARRALEQPQRRLPSCCRGRPPRTRGLHRTGSLSTDPGRQDPDPAMEGVDLPIPATPAADHHGESKLGRRKGEESGGSRGLQTAALLGAAAGRRRRSPVSSDGGRGLAPSREFSGHRWCIAPDSPVRRRGGWEKIPRLTTMTKNSLQQFTKYVFQKSGVVIDLIRALTSTRAYSVAHLPPAPSLFVPASCVKLPRVIPSHRRSSVLPAEAAKRSSALVSETAKKSKEIFSETASKSREIAAEATKQADLLAGQIKHLASDLPVPSIRPVPAVPPITAAASSEPDAAELERYGITDDLCEFVKGMTISTFRDFPLQDEPEMSDVPTVSNVRQDLNRHATLVLLTVKVFSSSNISIH
ncbi:uncharacterized protein LOC8080561 [Sorghum bicolor]|nr:uncharacterized protein LOC8080561 [Sorghum bicolor]|eukprot:XP_002468508.2 uncharacterized protein LOC8080561 [Sorghum bicolor]